MICVNIHLGIPDYLGNLDSPVLHAIVIKLTAKKLAKINFNQVNISKIRLAQARLVKDYQNAQYVNCSFTHKKIKDSRGRIWQIYPFDNGGLICKALNIPNRRG